MSLTEFLLERIAEDEAAAQRGLDGFSDKGWHTVECGVHLGYWAEGDCICLHGDRVLAECKAKRVAVDWYLNDDEVVMAATIKAMAAVYADHPDYRDEWRP